VSGYASHFHDFRPASAGRFFFSENEAIAERWQSSHLCSAATARAWGKAMSGWQRIGVVISVLWLIASATYFIATKNEAASESYAACIESSRMTGTRLREIGKHDEADAWERHSNDWCLRAAGYMSPVGLAHALLEGSYDSAVLWGFLLGPIALLWLVGSLVIGTVRWLSSGLRSIE
jgi:hypothetical protein